MNTLNCHIAARHERDDALPADGQLYHPAHIATAEPAEAHEPESAFMAYQRGFANGVAWTVFCGFALLVTAAALAGAFSRWLP